MDHPPRLLEHGLPRDGIVSAEDLRRLRDPFWTYEVSDGQVLVRSTQQAISWADLQSFPDLPNWRLELLEGALIVSPNAPGFRHQSCALLLTILLRQACPQELAVVIGPFEFVPVPTVSMQPDVLIARRPVGERRLVEAPVLAVEVLSPSTRRFDQHEKQAAYATYGVEHYWIVDPAGPSVRALKLEGGGGYGLVAEATAGAWFEVAMPVTIGFDPADLLDE